MEKNNAVQVGHIESDGNIESTTASESSTTKSLSKIISRNMSKIIAKHKELFAVEHGHMMEFGNDSLLIALNRAMKDDFKDIKKITSVNLSKYVRHYKRKDGKDKPSFEFIYAFTKYYVTTFEELSNPLEPHEIDEIAQKRLSLGANVIPTSQNSHSKSARRKGLVFLLNNILSKDSNYTVDFKSNPHPLLPTGKNKTECNCMHLPLINDSGFIVQKGVFAFEIDDSGFCHLTIHFENNSEEVEAVYKGFAVLANNDGANATFWCFTQLESKRRAGENLLDVGGEFFVCCFEAPSKIDWNVRVALSLNFNTKNQTPSMFRTLLYKGDMDEQHIQHYKGFLTLNSYWIPVYKKAYDRLVDYATDKCEDENLDAFFKGIKKDEIERNLNIFFSKRDSVEVYPITPAHPSDSTTSRFNASPKDFEIFALLITWLGANSINPDSNEISKETNKDADNVYKRLQRLSKSDKKS